MSVTDGGVTYGCTDALEDQAYDIARQGKKIERYLRGGGTITSGAECVLSGVTYEMVPITGLSTDGTSNSQTALANALSAARSGIKTLLILPPHANHYRYSNLLSLSENTFVVGYGARVKPLAVTDTAWVCSDNSGIFGLHMEGLDGAHSRWLERHESVSPEYDKEGAKDGSVSDANGGGANSDAWVQMFGKTNCIMMDLVMRGSLAGALRCTSTNFLAENCSMFRAHSDSFHVFKIAANGTLRRCRVFDGGDDGFSMIQYSDSAGGARPSNILLDECEVSGSRTRGMTTVSGKDILFLRGIVTRTNLAPFMAATTSAHSVAHCDGIKFVEVQGWRGSKVQGNAGASNAAGFALWSAGSHSWGVLNTEIRDSKIRWYTGGNRPDQFSAGIRINASAGPVDAPTQSGNDFAAITASE